MKSLRAMCCVYNTGVLKLLCKQPRSFPLIGMCWGNDNVNIKGMCSSKVKETLRVICSKVDNVNCRRIC